MWAQRTKLSALLGPIYILCPLTSGNSTQTAIGPKRWAQREPIAYRRLHVVGVFAALVATAAVWTQCGPGGQKIEQ